MKKAIAVLAAAIVLTMPLALASGEKAMGKTHDVTVEVVSADIEMNTLTFKTDSGEQKTAPVQGMAQKDLAKIKAGQKVVLTCQDDEKGAHQAVTGIKPAPAKTAHS